MRQQQGNNKLIAPILLSAMLLDPLLVLAALEESRSLDINNTATVTVLAGSVLIDYPSNLMPSSIDTMSNQTFNEHLTQLNGLQFSDLSDKELDEERAGFFNIFDLAIFAVNLTKSISQTRQTVSTTGAYTAQNFANQWLGTIGSVAGMQGYKAVTKVVSTIQGSSNAQSYGSNVQTISNPSGTWTLDQNGVLHSVITNAAIAKAPTPSKPISNPYLDAYTQNLAAQSAILQAAQAAKVKAFALAQSSRIF